MSERTRLHLDNGPVPQLGQRITVPQLGQRVTVIFHTDPSQALEFIVVGVKTQCQLAYDEVELQQLKRVAKP